jgi:predicted transcriptional regulator of viral defense system
MEPQVRTRSADGVIAGLAAAQHGVVTRAQLLARGVSGPQIRVRIGRQQLLPLYRGVYAVGHTELPSTGLALAAAWSAGPRGALCDVAAAERHGVRESNAAKWDVILPQRSLWRPQAGIRAHASATLRPEDVAVVDGVPVTTLARTVVDLAARHPARMVEKVLDELVVQQRYDHAALTTMLERPYLRGRTELRAILAAHEPGSTVTRSMLEERFLALCTAHALPRPRMNAWVEGVNVDAWWPGTPVAAELDSRRFHTDPKTFERDREKGSELVAAGIVLLRFTWRQLVDRPVWVASTARCALARGSNSE